MHVLFNVCVYILHITYICYMLYDAILYIICYTHWWECHHKSSLENSHEARPLSKVAGTGSHDSGSHTKRMEALLRLQAFWHLPN